MIGGCAVVRDDELAERLQFIHNAAGAVAGPFDAWLALRGTKTLHLRMRQHDANGREIAKWLAEQVGAKTCTTSACRRTRSTSSPSGRCRASAE